MNRFDYTLIPAYTMQGLKRYVEEHTPVGDFLRCVISNDLSKAVAHADGENIKVLPHLACYLYNEVPGPCWGSPEAYKAWITGGKDGSAD